MVKGEQFYDEKYLEGEEVIRPYKKRALAWLPDDPRRIMDVGCGTGQLTKEMNRLGHKVMGIDISNPALKKYKDAGNPGLRNNLHRASLPFVDESFDCIWCTEVLEHVSRPRKLLQEFHRVLDRTGKLIITVPNSAHLFYRLQYLLGNVPSELQHPEHINFYSTASLEKLFARSGFEIKQHLGRNLYAVLKESWLPSGGHYLLRLLRFHREYSFKFEQPLWILTQFTSFFCSLFSDSLMYQLTKSKRTGSNDE